MYGYAPSPYGSSSTNTHAGALMAGLYGTNGQDRFDDVPREEELRRRLSLHNTPAPDTPSMDDDSRGWWSLSISGLFLVVVVFFWVEGKRQILSKSEAIGVSGVH